MTVREALVKAEKYCAYQERCQSEMRTKLHSWKMTEEQTEAIIAELTEQGFLSEQRYANAFVSGKYHMKQWGRGKIVRYLKMQGVSERCIRDALLSVDFSDYGEQMAKIARKWRRSHPGLPAQEAELKLKSFLFGKGYETDAIREFFENEKNY